jgi:hypothetical protein
MTYTKNLSASVSNDLGHAISFHAQRFQMFCGLLDLKLEFNEYNLLKLTAIGTGKSIASLKQHLSQVCNTHWLFHCGRPLSRASRYFMSGSELLLFSVGSADEHLVKNIRNVQLQRFVEAFLYLKCQRF